MPRIAMLHGYAGSTFADSVPAETDTWPTINAEFNGVVAELRRALLLYQAKIILHPLAPPETRRGFLSAVPTYRNIIDRLDGPSREEVRVGVMSPSRWLASARTVQVGMQENAAQVSEFSIFNFLGDRIDRAAAIIERIGKTAESILDNLGAGVEASTGLWKYVAPALIVGGVGIVLWQIYSATNGFKRMIKLSDSRSLRGYRKRRHSRRRRG